MKISHRFRRLTSLLLAIVLICNLAGSALAGTYVVNKWFVSEINEAELRDLIPNSLKNCDLTLEITRAEMCEIAVNAYENIMNDNAKPQTTDYFSDTEDPIICLAYELGIVSGYTGVYEGMFLPDRSLTREEFIVILANLNRALGFAPNSASVSLASFNDVNQLDSWAIEATRQAILLGVVSGSTESGKTYLHPDANTTREQAIAMFLRCFKCLDEYYTMVVNAAASTQVSELVAQLLGYAQSFLGTPYVFGGTSPKGFDCSGFTQYCYRLIGISINRTAQNQYANGVPVDKDALMPGDLVFFANTYSSSDAITHVGIYIGNGQFIHAANSQVGVVISELSSSYYSARYYGARHILD